MTAIQAEQKLRDVVRRKHFSISTEDSYVLWLRRFSGYLTKVPPADPAERKIERFLTSLARQDVSASTQNQAFNALLFFYQECLGQKLSGIDALRAKREVSLRRAPAVDEVQCLISEVRDASGYPVRLVVKLLYGCGLRVTEPLSLRIRDIDLRESRFTIRRAKGGKDRVVAIPCSVISEISAQIEVARLTWQRDVAAQVPIKLPHQIARKYPAAQFSWNWAWLFPQMAPCRDPRGGALVRWHMLEPSVQRAVRSASRRISSEILPHELRHAYATHTLNRGTNPRAIQCVMGHKSLETTMGYLHAEALAVPSPLDCLKP